MMRLMDRDKELVKYLRSEKRIKKLKKKVEEWQAKHELAL
jgi:uncharacterized protein YecE (DUF72 family)